MAKPRIDVYVVVIIVFCLCFSIYLASSRQSFFLVASDTPGYQISELKDLSIIHRPAGLQLISLFFYIICGGDWDIADSGIVCFQYFITIAGSVFLYLAISEYIEKRFISFIIVLLASANILVFGFVHALLTECYAIAAMSFQLWCIVKTIKEARSKYIVWAMVVGLLCSLIRPSHLLTILLLAGFVVVYGCMKHKWILKNGLIAALACFGVIIGCCAANKVNHDYFGISDVKPFNDMATLLYAEAYDNPEYPDITHYVYERVNEETSNWTKAKRIVQEFGFERSSAYIRSCKKLHYSAYIRYLWNDLSIVAKNSVVFDYLRTYSSIKAVTGIIQKVSLPFTFGGLWIMTSICLIGSLAISVIRKRFLWFEIGVCFCVISVSIYSRISCHTDSLVRTGVHVLPCIFVVYSFYLKGIVYLLRLMIHRIAKNRERGLGA